MPLAFSHEVFILTGLRVSLSLSKESFPLAVAVVVL